MLTTTSEARRGRSLAERLFVRLPPVAHRLTHWMLSLPEGSRPRRRLLWWGASRTYAAYNRRDWAVNTLLFDPERYEFRAGDLEGAIPGMREVYCGTAGYLEAMELMLEAFSDLRVRLEELLEITPHRLVAVVRFRGRGSASGVPIDQITASIIDLRGGRVVRQSYWWDVEKGVARARATLGT